MPSRNGEEYWHMACVAADCTDPQVYILPAPDGCQRCVHGMLRKDHPPEKGARYNYEACAVGRITMLRNLPELWFCDLYSRRGAIYAAPGQQPTKERDTWPRY